MALRVGLIASPGTEGYHDFLGQLTGSGLGFHISVRQGGSPGCRGPGFGGKSAPCAEPQRLRRDRHGPGRGARADLAAFETEIVARAIAGASKPVFTGIGHTGDETVADVVAARACITPTECGHQIVVATRALVGRPRGTACRHAGPPGARPSSARPRRGMPRRAVTSQRRPGTTCACTAIAWARRRPHWGAPHLHGSDPARRLFAPMPPGWGPWPSAISGAWTSA